MDLCPHSQAFFPHFPQKLPSFLLKIGSCDNAVFFSHSNVGNKYSQQKFCIDNGSIALTLMILTILTFQPARATYYLQVEPGSSSRHSGSPSKVQPVQPVCNLYGRAALCVGGTAVPTRGQPSRATLVVVIIIIIIVSSSLPGAPS